MPVECKNKSVRKKTGTLDQKSRSSLRKKSVSGDLILDQDGFSNWDIAAIIWSQFAIKTGESQTPKEV